MAHPYAGSVDNRHERAHKMIERTGHKMARGGPAHSDAKQDESLIRKAIEEHEDHEHGGKHTKLKFKAGGAVEGEHARHHMGKRARGGRAGKGGKHVTNVIVAPQGGGAPGGGMRPPMPPPQAMQAPPPRPAAPPPPPPPQGAMPQGAGGPPMGGMRPPGAMKRGGGVKHKRARGGEADCDEDEDRGERARGGRTQRVEEAGVPSESLMQANRGGHIRRRDVGGSAGVPSNPTQMSAQQVQQIAQIRKQQAMAKQAQMAQQQGAGGMRPGMQGPMGAAPAARMAGNPSVPTQKRGGEVHVKEHVRRASGGHVSMEAGAGGGEGRIEKAREYGSGRGFKPREKPLHV